MLNLIEKRWCSLSQNTLTYCRSPGEKISKQLTGLERATLTLSKEPKKIEDGVLYKFRDYCS